MGHQGQAFITHEFNEAIAVQQAIVECGRQLSESVTVPAAKRALKQGLKEDERLLRELERLGGKFGASGEREEIAQAMEELAQQSAQSAKSGDPSDAYEALAVMLNMKRKQQDAAVSIQKIGRELGDAEVRDKAGEFHKAMKDSSEELVKQVGEMAVQIATNKLGEASQSA